MDESYFIDHHGEIVIEHDIIIIDHESETGTESDVDDVCSIDSDNHKDHIQQDLEKYYEEYFNSWTYLTTKIVVNLYKKMF